eukprot:184657-Rhodomonas_salina.2
MALQSGMIERGIRAFSQLLVVAVDAKRASWAGNERYLPAFGGRYPTRKRLPSPRPACSMRCPRLTCVMASYACAVRYPVLTSPMPLPGVAHGCEGGNCRYPAAIAGAPRQVQNPLSAYAAATRCPVLTERIRARCVARKDQSSDARSEREGAGASLLVCYAMPRTDTAYGATRAAMQLQRP